MQLLLLLLPMLLCRGTTITPLRRFTRPFPTPLPTLVAAATLAVA